MIADVFTFRTGKTTFASMSPDRPAATRLRNKSDVSTKGARTRGRLLAACSVEFAKKGFVATRISDIVARAGVSQPVFYLYFLSKQAAYDELVTLFGRRLQDAVGEALIGADVPATAVDARVRLTIQKLLTILWADPDLTQIGFTQSASAEALKSALCAQITDNLRAEQATGFFRPEVTPELFAQAFMGMMERFSRFRPPAPHDEQLADVIGTLILDGMRAVPRRR